MKRDSLPRKLSIAILTLVSDISDKDYSHTHKVWKGFDMKNLREYHDLYLKTDIIVPSNVFKAFMSTCLEHIILSIWLISICGLDWLGKLV